MNRFRDVMHSKLYKTADGRDLGFVPTGSSAIRSADLENTTPEPNMRSIGCSVAEIMVVRNFPKCEVSRSVVGPQYTLMPCTLLRYVRNVASEE